MKLSRLREARTSGEMVEAWFDDISAWRRCVVVSVSSDARWAWVEVEVLDGEVKTVFPDHVRTWKKGR